MYHPKVIHAPVAENPLFDAFLRSRNLDQASFDEICDPSHGPLGNIDEAVGLLWEAHEGHVPVAVLPDFDMDGIAAGSLLFAGLTELGFDARLYTPEPGRGYGAKEWDAEQMLQWWPDLGLVVTCDVGITAHECLGRLMASGAKVLVTDHHRVDEDAGLPPATVVIDPQAPGDPYEHKEICGAFVAFQLLCAYADAHADAIVRDRIGRLSVLAGIGTVADSMPVTHENRAVLKEAVGTLRSCFPDPVTGRSLALDMAEGTAAYCGVFAGLTELLGALKGAGKVASAEDVDEGTVGFYIAPCVNSVKRLGVSSSAAFDLFFGPDRRGAAQNLMALNEQRKQLVDAHMEAMAGWDQPLAPTVWLSSAPGGVLGLIAQKLERPDGPTLVVAQKEDGSWSGSGRSPEWYPARSRIKAHGDFAAGHEGAFGCGTTDGPSLVALAQWLEADAKEALGSVEIVEPKPDATVSTLGDGDCGIDVDVINDFICRVDRLAPFGRGFERPLCALRFRGREAEPQAIGSDGTHLKLVLPYGVQALWWGHGADADTISGASEVELRGSWEVNRYKGYETLQFKVDSAATA